MRVTTDFWVSALVRRVFSGGGFAAIVNHGAPEAGAVHILTRDRLGGVTLYAPAPQTSYDEARPNERLFNRIDGEAEAIDKRLDKERRFDPDIWVVEIEPGREPIDSLLAIVA